MANLIYVNNQLDFNSLERTLGVQFNDEYKNFHKFTERLWYEPHFPHRRIGNQQMLWDITVPEKYQAPVYDSNFNLTFADVTDRRALELEQLHEETGLPIIVNWSGGIDSTCIVAAIFKMCKPTTIKNTVVRLNNCSYFENPQFFRNIIVQNFNYTEVQRSGLHPGECIFVTGDPADQIWIHADIIEILYQYPNSSKNNVHTNPDTLLKFLETKTDADHARWFYNFVLESAQDSPVPVVTYEDFYWWANYNFYYSGNSFKAYMLDYSLHNSEGYELFMKTHVPWYTHSDYQQWSLHNNSSGIKLGNSIASYKEPAKKYIVEIDKNYHYYYYKSKVGGISLVSAYRTDTSNAQPNKIVAVYDNGALLRTSDSVSVQEFFYSNPRILK